MINYNLTLIIPCYNEEPILKKNVSEVIKVLDSFKVNWEIILIDDCSKDRTREIIDEIVLGHKNIRKLFHEKNIGRGGTVMDGIKIAKGEIVGYIDIDLEVSAKYIPEFVKAIRDGYDIAVAHRIYKFQPKSIDRWILTKGYHWLVNLFLRLPFKDTEAGYKFFDHKKVLSMINEIEDRHWFWDTEFMARAYYHNYKVKEIPSVFIRNYESPTTIRVIYDTIYYFKKLVRFVR